MVPGLPAAHGNSGRVCRPLDLQARIHHSLASQKTIIKAEALKPASHWSAVKVDNRSTTPSARSLTWCNATRQPIVAKHIGEGP